MVRVNAQSLQKREEVVDIVANSPLAKFNKDTKQQAIEVPRRASREEGAFGTCLRTL